MIGNGSAAQPVACQQVGGRREVGPEKKRPSRRVLSMLREGAETGDRLPLVLGYRSCWEPLSSWRRINAAGVLSSSQQVRPVSWRPAAVLSLLVPETRPEVAGENRTPDGLNA